MAMDNFPDDVPPEQMIDTLVRALQAHRDALVQVSLYLKDLFANTQTEQQQVVAGQLERYLADMARGVQSTQGGGDTNGCSPSQ